MSIVLCKNGISSSKINKKNCTNMEESIWHNVNDNLLPPNALGSLIGFCDKNYGTCVPQKKIMIHICIETT